MFTVVLDACVLVPFTLADTLLRIAQTGSYDIRWLDDILDEVQRNVAHLIRDEARARKRVQQMRTAFPFACVEDYRPLIPAMTNDPKDRHVLAAAVRSECHTIVTANLRDFPPDALALWDVDVLDPDEFLLGQLDLAPGSVMRALHAQSSSYENPPITVPRIIGKLSAMSLTQFADEVRRHVN